MGKWRYITYVVSFATITKKKTQMDAFSHMIYDLITSKRSEGPPSSFYNRKRKKTIVTQVWIMTRRKDTKHIHTNKHFPQFCTNIPCVPLSRDPLMLSILSSSY